MGFRLTSVGKVKKNKFKRKSKKRKSPKKTKRVVKRKPRKKRMYKYRHKKHRSKGLRNTSEWQEFQKYYAGKGFTQKEVARLYRTYKANKPSEILEGLKEGNISALTDKGKELAGNFMYDEFKRDFKNQLRYEYRKGIRKGGGLLGILTRDGLSNDGKRNMARYLNQTRGGKKAPLFDSIYRAYVDFNELS